MPKVCIDLPHALYEAVRRHDIAISAIAQVALEAEVRRLADVGWIESVQARRPRVTVQVDTSTLLGDARGEFGA